MGRAILVASVVVVCSFTFVLLQLWSRKRPVATTRGPVPILETRENGDIVSVDIKLALFERRLRAEEQRWIKLTADMDAMRKERDELRAEVERLQSDVTRLRRQVNARPQPAERPRPVVPPPDTSTVPDPTVTPTPPTTTTPPVPVPTPP